MPALAEDFKIKFRNFFLGACFLALLAWGFDSFLGWVSPFRAPAWRALGGFLLLLGFVLPSVSGRQLRLRGRTAEDLPRGTTDTLVTDGIFRYVRHPAFTGFMLLLAGIALLSGSAGFTFVSLPLGIARIVQFAYGQEEKEAREKFGAAYDAYAARTPAFFPIFWKKQ